MKQNWKKLASLLLVVLLVVLPLASLAEETEERTKREQWRREAIESGYYVKDEYALQVNSVSGLSEEQLSLAQQTLDAIRLEVTTFDDIDAVYTQYALRMNGQEMLTVDVRETETEQWFQTSLLPGHVLTAPLTGEGAYGLLIPISPFSLFTFYLPNLPGGVLSLSPEEAAYLEAAMDNYLFEIGTWVSSTQYLTEDLYVNDFEQLPATETRDAVDQSFSTTMRARELKVLMRLVADVFYEDTRLQEVLTSYLSYFGVTPENMKQFANEWPLAIASLEPLDAALQYTAHYNELGEIVGISLDVPRLYDPFPFEHLTANYEAKRDDTGLRGHGTGEVLLDAEGSKMEGAFYLQRGDLVDGVRSDAQSLETVTTKADGSVTAETRSYSQVDQRIEGETETIDSRYNSLRKGSDALLGQSNVDVTGTAVTTHLSEDGAFEGSQEYTAVLSSDGGIEAPIELALTVQTTTGDYTVPDFSGQQTAMLSASWSELNDLRNTVLENAQGVGLKAMSLLPPDVLKAIGSVLTGK